MNLKIMSFRRPISAMVALVMVFAIFDPIMIFAAPRPPQPPWPQATLRIYGFDAEYWRMPWNQVALYEDPAELAESCRRATPEKFIFIPKIAATLRAA